MRTKTLMLILALVGLGLAVWYWLKKSGKLATMFRPTVATPAPPTANSGTLQQRVTQQGADATGVIIGSISNGIATTISSLFKNNQSSTEYGDYQADYTSDSYSGSFADL